jgi:D-3-phosphoglycerate dehydrogenase
VGIIGVGAIGVMLANACVALDMNVLGFDPYISVEAAWGLSRDVRRAKSLDSLVAESDFITIHVPLNDSTKGTINAGLIAKMKNGVKIMNFARGGLVNTKDILAAIESGKVACYATDFPEEALLGKEGVIPIPHLGASTEEAEENCAVMACEQLAAYLETGNITNSVNYPDCSLDFRGGTRITVANRNIPNMIGQITSALASKQINIKDMINKNKGDFAYNIIDIDGDANGDVVEKIKSVEGVIKVRIIKG